MPLDPGAVRNAVIRVAKDVPTAIDLARQTDPALADFLAGKSLVGSWTVWVAILTPAIVWASGYYGFGFTGEQCSAVATVLTSLMMIIMRSITSSPITGVVKPATPLGEKPIVPDDPETNPTATNTRPPL
jgi:hypothetical protein